MKYPEFFTEPPVLSRLSPNAPILLGLSGGADSSALLHLLSVFREKTGAEIIAAHLNHGIRGEEYSNEADRDEAFCRELCKRLEIELAVRRLDIPKLSALSGRSLETEAREARYAFFAEIMRERKIKILATAHNADDNLETQLCNLSRGCGIDGMIGIPSCRTMDHLDGGIVIRPILAAQKSEIIEYCNENGVPYVTDSTNFEVDCTRNRIRHGVTPKLCEIFPNAKESALRLSRLAAEDSDFILSEAKNILADCGGKIRAEYLRSLHPSLAKRVIMLSFKEISDATLEYIHITEILKLLGSDKNGAAISLPDKKRAEVVDGCLCFREDCADNTPKVSYCQRLFAGLNQIHNTPFAVFVGEGEPQERIGECALYAAARIKNSTSLYAKNRASGDTIADGGVNKKIKKLMCDKKIPLADRASLPIIWNDESVLYVPLCAVCDSQKVRCGEGLIYVAIYKTEEKA